MPSFVPPPTPHQAHDLRNAIPHRNQIPKQARGRSGSHTTTLSSSSTLFAARDLIADAPTPRASSTLFAARDLIADTTTLSSSSTLFAARDLIADAPTPRAFSTLFKAASSASSPSHSLGAQLHAQAIVRGFLGDEDSTILSTAILNFYTSCRNPDLARQVFDTMPRKNNITWNTLIKGFVQAGRREEALELFRDMRRQDSIAPDKYTYPALLSGVGREDGGGCMQEFGGAVHAQVIKTGLGRDPFVGASLVSMYTARGVLEDVKVVFDDIDSMDPIVWSSMISAYVNFMEEEGALLTFYRMLCQDIEPRQFVYSSLFAACGSMSLLEMGRQVHAHSLKNNTAKDATSKNALLTMYSECGCISDAWKVFISNDNVNVVSYNSMISALGQHGFPKEAIELFRHMKLAGLMPDEVTMLNLLSCFNHAGLVHEGLQIFDSMEEEGIKPTYQHYACVIDMLARSGLIKEAMKVINEMPFVAETPLWRSILGACSKHRDIKTGKLIAEMLFEMEPSEATNYILLGNIYARLGRWVEAEDIRNLMDERGLIKDDAFSWIEMGQKTHRFGVDDRTHPLSREIYKNLNKLIGRIKVAGYEPDISFATHNVKKDKRAEESLYYHCEKLTFAFGDLVAPSGGTLRIMKNLRVCGDCHNAYKYFSLITGREIILRDNHRFHHFNKGGCSCGDYW